MNKLAGEIPVIFFINCDEPVTEFIRKNPNFDGVDFGGGRQLVWDKELLKSKFVKQIIDGDDFSCYQLSLVDTISSTEIDYDMWGAY